MTTALSIYLGSLLFGSVLILTSLIFGGDDSDMDKDFDKDIGFDKDLSFDKDVDFDGDAADGDTDGPAWLPFLSLRFWTFALGSFGLTGTILTFLGSAAVTTAVVSSGMGLVLGYFIAFAFQKLKKSNITSDTSSVALKNQVGSVLLDIEPNSRGKIRVHASNQIHDLMAITQDSKPIEAGEKIIIVSVKDGIANVTTLSNHQKPRPQKEIE
jgi:membrane protein implicated in regulation of membrane protease activity